MRSPIRTAVICFSAVFAMLPLGASGLAASDDRVVRVNVDKTRVLSERLLTFPPVNSRAIGTRRLVPIADYGSHTMYETSSIEAPLLVQELTAEGYAAEIAADLDHVRFQEYDVDPDTGIVTPAPRGGSSLPPGSSGLFVLTLRAYPLQAWLEALERMDIRILEELEPAAYLVRAPRDAPAGLQSRLSFVRGIFPLTPGMKKVGFSAGRTEAALRRMAIRAVEETAADSLDGPLTAVSTEPVTRQQHGRRTTYIASLSDLDAEVFTYFSNVYSVGPIPDLELSAERQGVLITQTPNQTTGTLTLPESNPNYQTFLQDRGITDFSNTKIAVLDSGFHLGTNLHPDFQNGGSPTIQFCDARGASGICWEPGPPSMESGVDERLHGTFIASIIGAFTNIGQRAEPPPHGYRYSLGLAPKATLVIDKMFNCANFAALAAAFNTIRPYSPNIINMSFNTLGDPVDPSGGVGCQYTPNSAEVDIATRADNWLFTISAGNRPEGGNCNYVRSPGTAKNGITAGATMNYTPDSLNWVNYTVDHPGICTWNGQPPMAYRDARHIPTYSVARNPASLVKPDLVAPATRITGPVGGVSAPPNCVLGAVGCRCTAYGIFCNDALALADNVWYGFSAGTSFAAPAVAGAAAVVRKWHVNVAGSNPSPAMTKAMLINGALDLGPRGSIDGAMRLAESTLMPTGNPIGNIPDPYQGWGMLSLTRLLGSYNNYFFYDQRAGLLPGKGVWQKYLYIRDGNKDTRVTLVWTDSPSTTGTTVYKAVNNLNLSLSRSSGSHTWYGNILSSGYSIPNPSPVKPDKPNNVEQVILPVGTFTTGEGVIVAVDPYSVMLPGQDFALFIDNATEPATSLQAVTPCRAIDTRNPIGPYGGPALTANFTRDFALANQCGIPANATAVALNVTVVGGTAPGSLRLFQAGIAPPSAETIYYSAGQVRGNNATIALAPGANLAARPEQSSGSVHMIVDVVGYFQQ